MVPVDVPASRAMSAIRVAGNPRATIARQAASRIWAGRSGRGRWARAAGRMLGTGFATFDILWPGRQESDASVKLSDASIRRVEVQRRGGGGLREEAAQRAARAGPGAVAGDGRGPPPGDRRPRRRGDAGGGP